MQDSQPELTITRAKVESDLVWFKVSDDQKNWQQAAEVDSHLIANYLEQNQYQICGICDAYVVATDEKKGAVVVMHAWKGGQVGGKRKRRPNREETKQLAPAIEDRNKELRELATLSMAYDGAGSHVRTFGFMGRQHRNQMELDNYGFVVKLLQPYHLLENKVEKTKRQELNVYLESWLDQQRNATELGTFFVLLLGSMGKFNLLDSTQPVRSIEEDVHVMPFVENLIRRMLQ